MLLSKPSVYLHMSNFHNEPRNNNNNEQQYYFESNSSNNEYNNDCNTNIHDQSNDFAQWDELIEAEMYDDSDIQTMQNEGEEQEQQKQEQFMSTAMQANNHLYTRDYFSNHRLQQLELELERQHPDHSIPTTVGRSRMTTASNDPINATIPTNQQQHYFASNYDNTSSNNQREQQLPVQQDQFTVEDPFYPSMPFLQQQQGQRKLLRQELQQQHLQQDQRDSTSTWNSAALIAKHHEDYIRRKMAIMMNLPSYQALMGRNRCFDCSNTITLPNTTTPTPNPTPQQYQRNTIKNHATSTLATISQQQQQYNDSQTSTNSQKRSFPTPINPPKLPLYNNTHDEYYKLPPNQPWTISNDLSSLTVDEILAQNNVPHWNQNQVSIMERFPNNNRSIQNRYIANTHDPTYPNQDVVKYVENETFTYQNDINSGRSVATNNVVTATAAFDDQDKSTEKVALLGRPKSKQSVKKTSNSPRNVKKVTRTVKHPHIAKRPSGINLIPEVINKNTNIISTLSTAAPTNDEQQQQQQQQYRLDDLDMLFVLPDWLVKYQQSLPAPPHQQLNDFRLLLKPLTPYNYFYRDERDNIVRKMDDDYDPLPLPVSDFSNERIQRMLYQRWYIDPVKERRLHRKTHGKISFQILSKSIAERWKHLSPTGREFYRKVARYDDIYYRQQKTILDTAYISNKKNDTNTPKTSSINDDSEPTANNDTMTPS